MSHEQTLDVRQQPPVRRPSLTFAACDALEPGGGLEVLNVHDPRPLENPSDAEHGGESTRDDLESGPAVWRVRTRRPAATPAEA